MNSRMDKKRILFTGAAVILVIAYFIGASFLLRSRGERANNTDLRYYHDGSSQILLTGKEYVLENEQEEMYKEARRQRDSVREEGEPEQEDLNDTAKSIVPEEAVSNERYEQSGTENNQNKDQGTGNNNGSDGGNGPGTGEDGNGNHEEPVKPDEINKTPFIESNIQEEPYGQNVTFLVRGTDYKGRTIDKFYYSVLFDGNLLYSTETSSDGWVTYRADGQAEGYHEVAVTVTDLEGNTASRIYPLYVAQAADIPVEEYVTLEVEARSIGYGYVLSVTEQIYKDESAAHFVKRTLEAYGFTPGMDDSSYLYRIWGIYAGEADVPEPIKGYIEEAAGELYGVTNPGALGERDYTANSGWVYMYNGEFQGKGLYSVTLTDGDVIHLGFTLWGGAEYDGTWSYLGGW